MWSLIIEILAKFFNKKQIWALVIIIVFAFSGGVITGNEYNSSKNVHKNLNEVSYSENIAIYTSKGYEKESKKITDNIHNLNKLKHPLSPNPKIAEEQNFLNVKRDILKNKILVIQDILDGNDPLFLLKTFEKDYIEVIQALNQYEN